MADRIETKCFQQLIFRDIENAIIFTVVIHHFFEFLCAQTRVIAKLATPLEFAPGVPQFEHIPITILNHIQ